MPRLFIGIKIPNPSYIVDIQNDLQNNLSGSNIKWVEPENFHITLKFLGDVESFFINSINQLLLHLSKKHKSFHLKPAGVGFFGSIRQPHVIWFGFRDNRILSAIQSSIDESLNKLGFSMEQKKFSPHLTLGRIKYLAEKSEFVELMGSNKSFQEDHTISEFQLIQSTLSKEGPVYEVIKSFPLDENTVTNQYLK
ncbi:RNA 2',3'-cyclic phosphodiesterase [subsurface metagenome]